METGGKLKNGSEGICRLALGRVESSGNLEVRMMCMEKNQDTMVEAKLNEIVDGESHEG
ncbi:hypothetical protein C1H46_037761 [Malus baccata]|uniref:Uncharacterized protein n=1 Tax=Malus baccata TaxID=106549 RepID=A0A540KRC9_MALBA|nr:hypothetical protein C1H46_037761 [Malus baccata]